MIKDEPECHLYYCLLLFYPLPIFFLEGEMKRERTIVAGYNVTRLHYPATQSFLPSILKPKLYHIPIKSTHTPLQLIPSLQHVYVENIDQEFLSSI